MAIASEYIRDSAKVRSCLLLGDYETRKEKEHKTVYEVQFDNNVNSIIICCGYTHVGFA